MTTSESRQKRNALWTRTIELIRTDEEADEECGDALLDDALHLRLLPRSHVLTEDAQRRDVRHAPHCKQHRARVALRPK